MKAVKKNVENLWTPTFVPSRESKPRPETRNRANRKPKIPIHKPNRDNRKPWMWTLSGHEGALCKSYGHDVIKSD